MPDQPSEPDGRRTVVVVDNDLDALDLVVEDLRLEGLHIVGTATEGVRAIGLCDELRPDVLVVDYRMPPGPTGIEVARSVVDRLGADAPRIVLYTNYKSSGITADARRLGVTVLPKGNIRMLRRVVSEVQPDLTR